MNNKILMTCLCVSAASCASAMQPSKKLALYQEMQQIQNTARAQAIKEVKARNEAMAETIAQRHAYDRPEARRMASAKVHHDFKAAAKKAAKKTIKKAAQKTTIIRTTPSPRNQGLTTQLTQPMIHPMAQPTMYIPLFLPQPMNQYFVSPISSFSEQRFYEMYPYEIFGITYGQYQSMLVERFFSEDAFPKFTF